MMKNKIIKWKKLIVCVILGLFFLGFFVGKTNVIKNNEAPQQVTPKIGMTIIKKAEIIDKKMVIKAIYGKQQIVGMEAQVSKSYTYTDKIFEDTNIKVLDWINHKLGDRSYQVYLDATAKMGIDLQDLKLEDINVTDDTIFIKMPKSILISLEIPYEKAIVKPDVGLLRFELKENEKQFLFGEASKSLRAEVLENKELASKASSGVQDALKNLLSVVPNVKNIVFLPK